MKTYRVTYTIGGNKYTEEIGAYTSMDASNIIKRRNPGCTIIKSEEV